MISQRIDALRRSMEKRGLDAWIAADADPHGSEYVAERYRARSWLSGFRGSVGTLVVTREAAGLWVDSRYYLEAESAIAGTGIELFKSGLPGVPEYPKWLADRLIERRGERSAAERPTADRPAAERSAAKRPAVGVCASTTTIARVRALESELARAGASVVPSDDLLDDIWTDRPGYPTAPVVEYSTTFAGESRAQKLMRVRDHVRERGAGALLLSSLDDIAWLTNLRGGDVVYNPLFLAFLAVTLDEAVLFMDSEKLDSPTAESLAADGYTIAPYRAVREYVANRLPDTAVLLSPEKTAIELRSVLPESRTVIEETDITTFFKARKNRVELEGIRSAMRRDGVAMVRFLRWIEESVPGGEVTERSAAAKLEELRAAGKHHVGPSFPTISGFGEHGAIVHYRFDEESAVPLGQGVYLVDSGAHYLDGTTDITRTIMLGRRSKRAAADFTLVLKAHIALATLRFPKGTAGVQLDAVARAELWRTLRNYGHGTGHGVGCYLNVHEGPQKLATRLSDVPIDPGMITSNEPGLYRRGEYGIRIENLVHTVEDETGDFGPFLRFETLTLCPIDLQLIDASLLTEAELEWVNSYHEWVREELSPFLEPEDRRWLEEHTRPIERPEDMAST